jgi:aspartate/methionine/tyrosine aminotransferase
LKKEKLFGPVRSTILNNFTTIKKFMGEQDVLEWVEPQGGCVCFPRIRNGIDIHSGKFHDLLLKKYRTYVGRGHWFEEDGRYMRIGYSWENSDKLKKGLSNILSAIGELI